MQTWLMLLCPTNGLTDRRMSESARDKKWKGSCWEGVRMFQKEKREIRTGRVKGIEELCNTRSLTKVCPMSVRGESGI